MYLLSLCSSFVDCHSCICLLNRLLRGSLHIDLFYFDVLALGYTVAMSIVIRSMLGHLQAFPRGRGYAHQGRNYELFSLCGIVLCF